MAYSSLRKLITHACIFSLCLLPNAFYDKCEAQTSQTMSIYERLIDIEQNNFLNLTQKIIIVRLKPG